MSEQVPKTEIESRLHKLQQNLAAADLDAALILQNSDLFYCAGTIQQAHLYVPAAGEALLMVRKDFDRARGESPIENVISLSSPKQLPDLLRNYGCRIPDRLGMELDVLPVNLYALYRKIFADTEISDFSTAIRLQRAVKSAYEIQIIEEAARRSDQVAAAVPEFLREGIPEIELAGLVEARARKLGHQGIIRMRLWGSEMFYGHLMAGPSAAVPSFLASPTGGASLSPAVAQGPSLRPIGRNEPVLVDYVFAYQGYLSDHTRVFALGGVPESLQQAHRAMLQIQARVKSEARAGVRSGDIYDIATTLAAELGYGEHFMGTGPHRIRFTGHGIGLELDEFPFLAKGQDLSLEENMVIAFEPKLIFPGIGVVGIENSHVVTKDGLRQLGQYEEDIVVV